MKAIQVLKNCLKYSDYGNDIEEKEYIRKAIAELEELENRSCENCKHLKITNSEWGDNGCNHQDIYDCYDDGSYVIPKDFCCNRYEPKQ